MEKSQQQEDLWFMAEAITEARRGLDGGGIPIGAIVVAKGEIIGRGHNQRVQRGSSILHAEMDAFENAGRQPPSVYAYATMYSTLSPCTMCGGAIIHYCLPRVVIAENRTVARTTLCEDWLRERGVEVVNLDLAECFDMMADFIRRSPQLWNEDIGRLHVS
ncbi:MAG: nucleoside deaminase [Chloroflexi bacterium]|nr:MAG: nucleoside deaminase [Chloroflexota bacterium]